MLEQIIQATEQGAEPQAVLADLSAFENIGAAATPSLYRGAGTEVALLQNNPQAILQATGLTWNPVKLPLEVKGSHGGHVGIPRFALWKSGYADAESGFLDVCTDSYKPHTNQELMGSMCEFAAAAGLVIDQVVPFSGGARLLVSANARVQREVKVGDMVALRIELRSAHQVGTSTTVMATAYRLCCLNGARVAEAGGIVRMSHRQLMTSSRKDRVREFIDLATASFNTYLDRVAVLYDLPASPNVRRALFLQMFGTDEDWASVTTRLRLEATRERAMGAELLERLLQAEESSNLTIWADVKPGRLLTAVTQATKHQPGAVHTKGTMAHLYNGVTYWNSQVRGSGASAVEAATLGRYQSDSGRALDLLEREYVPAMQQVLGRRNS